MRRVNSTDVLSCGIPQEVDTTDEKQLDAFMERLARVAEQQIWRQWDGAEHKPVAIDDVIADWLITDKPAHVEQFQPAHDCAQCREGNTQAALFLLANPGRWVAMANLTYTEVWAE